MSSFTWWSHTGSPVSSSTFLSTKKMWTCWRVQQRHIKVLKGLKNLSQEEGLRELGLVSLEKVSEGIWSIYINTSREGAKMMKPGSSQFVLRERIKSNGHKLKHRRFCLNIRKIFFYCVCNWVLAQCCSVLSIPGHTENLAEHCPVCPAPADPAQSRALNWMGFSGVSWLQTLCDTPGIYNVGKINEFYFTPLSEENHLWKEKTKNTA